MGPASFARALSPACAELDQPTCTHCTGELVRQEKVTIPAGGSNVIVWTLVWVCTNCSAAFPIVTGSGGFLRKATPLYENGQRLS